MSIITEVLVLVVALLAEEAAVEDEVIMQTSNAKFA